MNYCKGPPELVQHFRLYGEFTSALHVLNLIWIGNIACLSQWEEGVISRSSDFHLPSLRVEEEGGGRSAPCANDSLYPLHSVSFSLIYRS
jgi:hypothetical protein